MPEYVSPELAKDDFFAASKGKAIIDCMMNLPLLFWASEVTGHPFYKSIAIAHADTTIKYFVRGDNSVCHGFLFDTETGEPLGESNSCGYADGSSWARGTSWAVYGFAIGYAYTKKREYLNTAVKIFEKFIEDCKGEMPVWDFGLPETETPNKDTSATAIMLCAASEILKYTDNERIRDFEKRYGEMIMKYIDLDLNNNGLLKEQNGKKVYASYGDYFLTEYLCVKYKNAERIW